MLIAHIESGLGNQMLAYLEYLAVKKTNPEADCYIETMLFDIPECQKVICMWNGYELKKIFNIEEPNIQSLYTKEEWNLILDKVTKSTFWNDDWNYSTAIVSALDTKELSLKNISRCSLPKGVKKTTRNMLSWFSQQTLMGYMLKYYYIKFNEQKYISSRTGENKLFMHFNNDDNVFLGHQLTFKYKNMGIEKLKDEIAEKFIFPPINETQNIKMMNKLNKVESVAIHARRGDMLSFNKRYYKYGFFKRATKLIRSHIVNPVFVFFCDPSSVDWCKKNLHIFGLTPKDTIWFVDWNKGENSYRDIQLMAACKHNIITNSTFGWWGSFLNHNPTKMTISPEAVFNTTHWV